MYTERKELVTYIYDGHKDAYGVKGRHYNFDAMSIEELRDEADRISKAITESIAEDAKNAAMCVEEFNEVVQECMDSGAEDRATALRWMTQDGVFYHRQSVEHWVYDQGFLFTSEGKALVEELMDIVTFQKEEW